MRMYSPDLAFHYVDGSVTKLLQSSTNASDHCAIARGGVRLASNRDKIFLRLYLAVRFYLQNRYIF